MIAPAVPPHGGQMHHVHHGHMGYGQQHHHHHGGPSQIPHPPPYTDMHVKHEPMEHVFWDYELHGEGIFMS
jgi:hypothetical protein